MKKKALFIDRDGTIIIESPITEQVNSLDEMTFLTGVIRNLYFIAKNLDFELVMVTNQDGLGTENYPQEVFDSVQNKMLEILEGEGITFSAIHIDKSYPQDNLPTRKPGTGMLTGYMDGSYDLVNSFVMNGARDIIAKTHKNDSLNDTEKNCIGLIISIIVPAILKPLSGSYSFLQTSQIIANITIKLALQTLGENEHR
mgnify:CR=1 FL=1